MSGELARQDVLARVAGFSKNDTNNAGGSTGKGKVRSMEECLDSASSLPRNLSPEVPGVALTQEAMNNPG